MTDRTDRQSPWARNVILLLGFLVLVVVGILTVILPALEEPEVPETPASTPEPAQ